MKTTTTMFTALMLLVFSFGLRGQADGQGVDTTDYFPLHVGDSSIYYTSIPCPPSSVHERHGPSLYSLVTDTARIRGEKYFIRDKFFFSPDTLRRDGAGNILIRTNGEDGVFYRLNVAVGDTWNFPIRLSGEVLYYTVTLQSRTDTVTVHAGQFTDCLRFYFDIPTAHDDEFWDWLAPGVGLVFHCVQEPRELYEANVNGVHYPGVTSVQKEPNVIGDFELYQNYPNPFNPSTTISFSLPKNAFVSLKVYNTLGEEVASLVNGEIAAGRHEVRWDAENMPSGVYFYQLRAGEFQQWQKMVLMK
jgi:hypothetical protein